MATPPNFSQTLLIIKTLQSLRPRGCSPSAVGYTVAEIHERLGEVFPSEVLTLDDVETVVDSAYKQAVLLIGGQTDGEYTYYVNGLMAQQNPINVAYLKEQAGFTGFVGDPVTYGHLPGAGSGSYTVTSPDTCT